MNIAMNGSRGARSWDHLFASYAACYSGSADSVTATEQFSSELWARGARLSPIFIHDLRLASRGSADPSGSSFIKLPWSHAWGSWLKGPWRELVRACESGVHGRQSELDVARHLITSLALSGVDGLPEPASAQLDVVSAVLDSAARMTDSDWLPPLSSLTGSTRLAKLVRDQGSPSAILGSMDVIAAVTGGGVRFPIAEPLDIPMADAVSPPVLSSQVRGGTKPRDVPQEYGLFMRRDPGPMPSNITRLDPTEYCYLHHNESVFYLRASEGALRQRFFKGQRDSMQRNAVQVDVMFEDSIGQHQWKNEHGRLSLPIASYTRTAGTLLILSLVRSFAESDVTLILNVEIGWNGGQNKSRRRVDPDLLSRYLNRPWACQVGAVAGQAPALFERHDQWGESVGVDDRNDVDARYRIHVKSNGNIPSSRQPGIDSSVDVWCAQGGLYWQSQGVDPHHAPLSNSGANQVLAGLFKTGTTAGSPHGSIGEEVVLS